MWGSLRTILQTGLNFTVSDSLSPVARKQFYNSKNLDNGRTSEILMGDYWVLSVRHSLYDPNYFIVPRRTS